MTDIQIRNIKGELFFEDVKLPAHLQDVNIAGVYINRFQKELENAMNREKPFKERFGSFVRGENIAGRGTGAVLDVVTFFLPFGQKINDGRDAVRLILERKNKEELRMNRVKKWIKQPSTKAGIVVVAGILAYFGVNINPELLGESLNMIVEGAALVVAGAVGLYEAFREEKTDEE